MPDVGAQQRAAQKFIVFTAWEKMNTRLSRFALPENQLAWAENLQPIGENNLVPVPAANAPLVDLNAAVFNNTVSLMFFANLKSIDYMIVFTAYGGALAVNLEDGTFVKFAPDGTFGIDPDMTVFSSDRILIADRVAGYCTWDGTTFVKGGGVSPNIAVTNGGTTPYTSVPAVAITGGSGTGAAAHAVLDGSGFVVKVVLDNPGSGYNAGDVLHVTFTGGGGSGAAATARIFPITACTTIAVFAGRVWTANGRVLAFTGTGGFDDTDVANAAGSVTFADSDLSHEITALRSLNNYLFVFGDQSVRQIGSISIAAGSITIFTPFVLSSDVGTTFRMTIASYNRLVLFANQSGVYAIFGASVEKISDDLDGIFSGPTMSGTVHSHVDFTLPPQAALQDLRNIHCYVLLVRYVETATLTRTILLVFQEKTWFVVSQGDHLRAIASAFPQSTLQWETFASGFSDITQLLQDTTIAVPVKLKTAMSPHGNPVQAKQPIRAGLGAVTDFNQRYQLCLETENNTRCYFLDTDNEVIWINNEPDVVMWSNVFGAVIHWQGRGGFKFPYATVEGYGKFLGATLTASIRDAVINQIAIEYQDRALWGVPP